MSAVRAGDQPAYNRVLLKLSGEAFAGGGRGERRHDAVYRWPRRSRTSPRGRFGRRSSSAAATSGAARRRRTRTWIARPPTTWACSRPSSTRSRCRTRSRTWACPRACRPPSRCTRSPSRTSAAAPSATWRRAASSSSRPAPATRISPPTRPPRCARVEMGAEAILKATKVDGIYTRRSEEGPDRDTLRRRSTIWKCCSAGSK